MVTRPNLSFKDLAENGCFTPLLSSCQSLIIGQSYIIFERDKAMLCHPISLKIQTMVHGNLNYHKSYLLLFAVICSPIVITK